MITALAFALLVGPVNLTGSFSGFPGLQNPSALNLRVTGHNVAVKLFLLEARSESLTLIKNGSAAGGAVTLTIPTRIRRAMGPGAFKAVVPAGSWDKVPVAFSAAPLRTSPGEPGFSNQDGWAKATVQVKPNATHALRLSWSGDLLTAGKDLKMRALAYDVSGAAGWPGGVASFNYAIQYQFTDRAKPLPGGMLRKIQTPVFSVQVMNPETGWQVGDKGGFWTAKPLEVPEDPVLAFSYYPGGFRDIGSENGARG